MDNPTTNEPVLELDSSDTKLENQEKLIPNTEKKQDNETTEPESNTTDERFSRRKNPPPPGMSLSAYKKQLRREKFEAQKVEWNLKKKEKRKELKAKKRKLKELNAESQTEAPKSTPKKKKVTLDVDVIIDCGFDELMKPEVRLTFINETNTLAN